MAFIASHAIGQGAVIWVLISEIFPNNVRALGQSFGASVHWVFAALITLITPLFLDKESGIFGDNPWPILLSFIYDGLATDMGAHQSARNKRHLAGRSRETGS